jgi:hypothetical protein
MLKKVAPLTIAILILTSAFLIFNQNTSVASTIDHAKLNIFAGPLNVLADNNTYRCIFVQLQDSSGQPARALQDTTISLSSSLTNIGTVDSSIIIPKGSTYASANFNSTFSPGTTVITASATGYATVLSSMTTIGPIPSAIAVYGFPSTLPADGNSYDAIMVQLQDSSGSPARAPQGGVQVMLSCSDTTVGTVTPFATILEGQTYALATLNTTYKAGSSSITAVATDLQWDRQSISTFGFIPSKLAIYCVPTTLPSDNKTYQAIQVQLQDAQGRPAKDPETDVNVNQFSSQSTVGLVSSTLTIPFGKTQATGNLTVTNAPGTTSITAQASGYTTGQTSITTYLIDYLPLQITVATNLTIVNNGYTTVITAYVTANGAPVMGATITFASNNGGAFTSTIEQGNGYYNTSFTAPSFSIATNCTITVSGSKLGYLGAQATTQLKVTPAPSNNTGTLALCIKDSEGNTLKDTNVSSTVQPTGIQSLVDVTNATGYVNFQNVTAGVYTFKIIKEGYLEMNQTIDYNGQPLVLTIALFNSNTKSNDSTISLIVIVAIAATVIVIAVVSSLYIVRRKKSPNIKKLKEMQKQLKNKYE